jgi:hypothetical protein
VELLGGLGDCVLDDGAFGIGGVLGAIVVDVDPLVGRRFGPVDRIDAGGGDAAEGAGGLAVFGDEGELAEDADECSGERVEAKVGVPEAELKLIGHGTILLAVSLLYWRSVARAMRR